MAFEARDQQNTGCNWEDSNLWVFTFTGPLFYLVAVLPMCPRFVFELSALRSFECVVTLEPRTTRHSTNPERVPACKWRHSNSCKPSASFLPESFDVKRHLVSARSRTPVGDFDPPSRAAADRIIMSAGQRSRWQLPLRLPDAVAAASACEPQVTQAAGRDHDQCSHLENLERSRDPLV